MEVGGEDPQGQSAINGATRQIAGTQSKQGIPLFSEEPGPAPFWRRAPRAPRGARLPLAGGFARARAPPHRHGAAP